LLKLDAVAKVNILSKGCHSESDVPLARLDAIIIGFQVRLPAECPQAG
jgi:hypothetical protein